MLRTPPAPAIKAKSIEQQNTDFTTEGSPPPGTVGTLVQLTGKTPALGKSTAMGQAKRGKTRAHFAVPTASAPKLPHEREESFNAVGTTSSEPMKRADRTYRKLKQSR